MLIHHFDPTSGVYQGSGRAEPDPHELQLARDAVYSSRAAVADEFLTTARERALQAFAEAAAGADVPADLIQEAEAARDFALAGALEAHDRALAEAREAAAELLPVHWLIPANAVTDDPPSLDAGQEAVWIDGRWSVRPIVNADDEPAPPPSVNQLAASARRDRTKRMNRVRWLIDRHRDEVALSRTTTLKAAEYKAVLRYLQDLRDVAAQPGFPTTIDWPELDLPLLAATV